MLLKRGRKFQPTKLSFSLSTEALLADVYSLLKHNQSQYYDLWLISSTGSNTECKHGPMQPTKQFAKLTYLQNTIYTIANKLDTIIGRTRLIIVKGNTNRKFLSDYDYYWDSHSVIYLKIQSDSSDFIYDTSVLKLMPAETCILDGSKEIVIKNRSPKNAIYLSIDIVTNKKIVTLLEDNSYKEYPAQSISDNPNVSIPLETNFFSPIIHPSELLRLLQKLLNETENITENDSKKLVQLIEDFYEKWRNLWVNVGSDQSFFPVYQQVVLQFNEVISTYFSKVCLKQRSASLASVVKNYSANFIVERLVDSKHSQTQNNVIINRKKKNDFHNCFNKAVFIVSAPRSGSSLLFELLTQSENFYTIKGKGHGIIEKSTGFIKNFQSNILTEEDATETLKNNLLKNYINSLYDNERKPIYNSNQLVKKYLS